MKLGAVRGLAQNQVLAGGDVGRARVTSTSAAGGAHEPLDGVLRQGAIDEFVTDTQAQSVVVRRAFRVTSWCHGKFTRISVPAGTSIPERLRSRRERVIVLSVILTLAVIQDPAKARL
jgi:hypothetical protein